MAYRGKIGFHFPGRGNPNIDASDIMFLPAGITNPTSNDLVQVNKVYAIPAGVTITSVAQLQNYVVWEKIENKKYILRFYWSENNSMALTGIELNGSLAGSAITNGEHRQKQNGQYDSWTKIDSSTLASLANGTGNTSIYGVDVRIEITTNNAVSFGLRYDQYYVGVNPYNFEIRIVNDDDTETVLYTETIYPENLKGTTKTITL